ncbi:hypothetical protein CQA53_10345 [Helicobacter didelphidarum]|uniref:Uncharacterized protein n=1 Tax=Helicobacter didelphidarum TaxID=2040648 RepID=A0A3D8I971_9HELI|nr:hypothetical protein [Helicobacter didelphidarum]RDU61304.1 hypothetical protein CQA53_10345 [Helicobacter didelphidarum]
MNLFKSVISYIKNTEIYKQYRYYRKEKGGFEYDVKYFTTRHRAIFGYTPDFSNPQTFNEKIIHRILYDRNPIYTILADKLKARIYIAQQLKSLAYNQEHTHIDNHQDSRILMGGGGG